jgi:hypothetical protein
MLSIQWRHHYCAIYEHCLLDPTGSVCGSSSFGNSGRSSLEDMSWIGIFLPRALTNARIALPDSFSRLESIMSLPETCQTISRHFFSTALCDIHSSKPTVARDKIYGLLGITVDGLRLFPAPSHSQHYSIIFRNLANAQITSQQSLDFILLKGDKPVTPSTCSLPSWVPNWLELHPASYEWRNAQYIRDEFSGTSLTDQGECLRACKVNRASVVVNGASLHVKGQFFNAIWQVGSVYGDKDRQLLAWLESHRNFKILRKELSYWFSLNNNHWDGDG